MLRYCLRLAIAASAAVVLGSGASRAESWPREFDPRVEQSTCYSRVYSEDFLKSHPNVKLSIISVSGNAPYSKGSFQLKFEFFGKKQGTYENYDAIGYCKPKGAGYACTLESDGGNVNLIRTSNGFILSTRRVEIERLFSDLVIESTRGGPTRSFTLRRSKDTLCTY